MPAAAPPTAPEGDPPARRPVGIATRAVRWSSELGRVPIGLLEAYLPGIGGINARTREQLIVAVADLEGVRTSALVHGAWLDFLGRRDPDEALLPLFDYARACVEAGHPVDATVLEAAYPAPLVRSVRATVARAELGTVVGGRLDRGLARLTGRRRFSPLGTVGDVVGAAAALPLAVPTMAVAGVMGLGARLAPRLPAIDLPPATDANLVVHLLAEAVPTYLGNVVVRTSLVWSPLPVAIAFRMDGTAATIRVGRGRVAIDNGVHPDALLVVDGGVEPLVQTVAASILRDLAGPLGRGH